MNSHNNFVTSSRMMEASTDIAAILKVTNDGCCHHATYNK